MTDSLVTVQCVRCGKDLGVPWYRADCAITCMCAQEDFLRVPVSDGQREFWAKLWAP